MAAAKSKKGGGGSVAKPDTAAKPSTKISPEASTALLGAAPDAAKLPEALKATAPVEGATAGATSSNGGAANVSWAQVIVARRIKAHTKKLQRMESYLNAPPESLDPNQRRSLTSRPGIEAAITELQEVVKQLAASEVDQKAAAGNDKKPQLEAPVLVPQEDIAKQLRLQRSFFALHSYVADRAGWSGAPPSFVPRSVPAVLKDLSGDTTQAIRALFLRLTALPTSDDVSPAASENEMQRRMKDAKAALQSLTRSDEEAIAEGLTTKYADIVKLIESLEHAPQHEANTSVRAEANIRPATVANGTARVLGQDKPNSSPASNGSAAREPAAAVISFLQASEVGDAEPSNNVDDYNAPVPILPAGIGGGNDSTPAPFSIAPAPEGGPAGDSQVHVSAYDPARGAIQSLKARAEAGQETEIRTNGKTAEEAPKFNWADDEGDDLGEPPAEWSTPATVAGTPAQALSGAATPREQVPALSASTGEETTAAPSVVTATTLAPSAATPVAHANSDQAAEVPTAPAIETEASQAKYTAAQPPSRPPDARRQARIPQVDDDGFEQVVTRKNARASERGGHGARGSRGDTRGRGRGGDARGRGRGSSSGAWAPATAGEQQAYQTGAHRGRGQAPGHMRGRGRGRGATDGSGAAESR